MIFTYKRLSELPVQEIAGLWNRSFEGYYVDASMTLDQLIARVAAEGLSLERSLACYADGQPAGIVMNVFRETASGIEARNGGTAVMPEYRGKGVGKAMMERNEELYKAEGVAKAYLEAISVNERAIRLYEGQGYRIADRLKLLSGERYSAATAPAGQAGPYTVRRGPASEAVSLPWYTPGDVWQASLPSLKDGESVIVRKDGRDECFALYRRSYDASGRLTGIILYRCEAAPGIADTEGALQAALNEVWLPGAACKRSAFNIPASATELLALLEQAGFAETMEQVLMMKEMA